MEMKISGPTLCPYLTRKHGPVQCEGAGSLLLQDSGLLGLLALCKTRSSRQGICVHSSAIKLGFQDQLLLNNHLLPFYASCYGIDQARKIFDRMYIRDVVSWTSIISVYVRCGNHQEALDLFEQMLRSGVVPNEFTYSIILQCASSLLDLDLVTRTHAQTVKCGFEHNAVLGSTLIDSYSKCNMLEEASRIFTEVEYRDVISWTAMISACIQAEDWGEAMRLYASMIASRVVLPNEFTYSKLLKACTSLGSNCARTVHAHIIRLGIKLNLVVKTSLVDMYSKCHRMADALKVMKQTSESGVMLLTALITGYCQTGDYKEAIAVFQQMEIAKISPNSFTFAKLVDVCSDVPVPVLGKQMHSRVIKAGLTHDVSVGNALVDLYAKWPSKSGSIMDFVRVFEEIASPNVVSWTTLIAGLVRHECEVEAFAAFEAMQVDGVCPNSFTLSAILKGCESPKFVAHVEKLHAYILKAKLGAWDISVGNSLVDAYARFGRVGEAMSISREMPSRDVFTYTSLAKGLNQLGLHRKALDIIACMHDESVKIDGYCVACFLSASASLAVVEMGKQLHSYSVKSGLNSWISVSNGLIDMYGKCGSMDEAHRVFVEVQEPNVVSWNGLISGLASNGQFCGALSAFEDMRLAGACPDGVTFLLVLYACSHGGLVDMGIEYFNAMSSNLYGVPRQPDHYVCLVDMLGRAGRLEEAACAIETMPFEPDALIYKTLLGACKVHRNLVLGECMATHAMELDPMDPAVYVLLAGIYDDAGKLDMGEQTRRMMKERTAIKCPGQSWIRNSLITTSLAF
ncbi:hypothetical protein J5N97_026874 [Dioscorea zingiberensis]|uniref:Pentatricopeptide repeat-containing protein n=1 Tax=Dioscorea zingiberensis TaxID=325984 RepID=A0A9D5C351_9LILI|nr:hypothetical protein J5N97_026874 [Dioscorea zingiberensis]